MPGPALPGRVLMDAGRPERWFFPGALEGGNSGGQKKCKYLLHCKWNLLQCALRLALKPRAA